MNGKLLAATLAGAIGGAAITHAVTPEKPPAVTAPKLTANSCGCWDIERDDMVGLLQPHEKTCPPGQRVLCGAELVVKVK